MSSLASSSAFSLIDICWPPLFALSMSKAIAQPVTAVGAYPTPPVSAALVAETSAAAAAPCCMRAKAASSGITLFCQLKRCLFRQYAGVHCSAVWPSSSEP